MVTLLSIGIVSIIGTILSMLIEEKEKNETVEMIMERIDERIRKECKSDTEYKKYHKVAEMEVRRLLSEKI